MYTHVRVLINGQVTLNAFQTVRSIPLCNFHCIAITVRSVWKHKARLSSSRGSDPCDPSAVVVQGVISDALSSEGHAGEKWPQIPYKRCNNRPLLTARTALSSAMAMLSKVIETPLSSSDCPCSMLPWRGVPQPISPPSPDHDRAQEGDLNPCRLGGFQPHYGGKRCSIRRPPSLFLFLHSQHTSLHHHGSFHPRLVLREARRVLQGECHNPRHRIQLDYCSSSRLLRRAREKVTVSVKCCPMHRHSRVLMRAFVP